MTYATKEKLATLTLLGMARQSVALYAQPCDQDTSTEAVLTLAAEYARNGADYSVVATLEYPKPDVEVA